MTARRYAKIAESYWTTYLPSRVAQMKDPATFFQNLGEQVMAQVRSALVDTRPEASLTETSTYLDAKAAHDQVRKAAEETALHDLVFLTPEPGTETHREPRTQMLGWEDEADASPPAAPTA